MIRMAEFGRELALDEIPTPPLYTLVDSNGADLSEETEVGGEPARVRALFSSRELAEEFSGGSEEHGMQAFANREPRGIPSWREAEAFARREEGYVLVVSGEGAGLFHAGDVARMAVERAAEIPFPLYILADERGESPLISVEVSEGEVMVAALFTSPENARAFREKASHLELPGSLGTIEDTGGLRRHALVAREAGADYAVMDPESGPADAIPVEELIR